VQDQSRKTNKFHFNFLYAKFTSERVTITRISVESFVPKPLIALCKRSAKNVGRSRIHVIKTR
jgi:hypothetical protein